MVLKTLTRSTTAGIGTLVKYILREERLTVTRYSRFIEFIETKQNENKAVYVAGIKLNQKDIKYLLADMKEAQIYSELKNFKGTTKEFIEQKLIGNTPEIPKELRGLATLAQTYPTAQKFANDLLYHGTIEPIEGKLRGGGFDNILWTAETPAIAQNYIPESGSSWVIRKPHDHELQTIWNYPRSDFENKILKHMGYEFTDVRLRESGEVSGWNVNKPMPTNEEAYAFIEQTLGYTPNGEGFYKIKRSENDIAHADYKAPGTLFISAGKSSLKIFDATELEFDMQNPAYLELDAFKKLAERGYDGVKINDVTQTVQGNFPHTSIGIFPSGAAKLNPVGIPAKHVDISQHAEPHTKEFNPSELYKQANRNKEKPFVITHNIRNKHSIEGIIKELEQNEENRTFKRAGQTTISHTILSWANNTEDGLITDSMLRQMADEYIRQRGSNNLFCITKHLDRENTTHLHIAMSGTQLSGKSSRISKADFQKLKVSMQDYQIKHFPQLVHSLPNFNSHNVKNKNMEQEKSKRHERTVLAKESLIQLLDTTYKTAKSSLDFADTLHEQGHEVYFRNGKMQGIIYEGNKYRFSKLEGYDEKLQLLDMVKEMEAKELGKNERGNGFNEDKKSLLELLESTFKIAESSFDFADMLDEKGYEVYFQEGTFTPAGIVYNDTRYQFSEIGFDTNFEMFDMMKAADEIEPLIPELEEAWYHTTDARNTDAHEEIEVLAPIEDITAGMTSDEVREYQQDLVNQNRAFEEAHGIDRDAGTTSAPNQEPVSEIENIIFENMRDDRHMEKEDPEYGNPKHYTNGTFDRDEAQALAELQSLSDLRQGLQNRGSMARDADRDTADADIDEGRDTEDTKRDMDDLKDLRNSDDNEHDLDLDNDCYCMDR